MPLLHYNLILNNREKANYLKADIKEKVEKAYVLLKSCKLCEHKCMVNRYVDMGFCKVKNEIHIFGAHEHFGEEHMLIPSGTIFFSGCTFRCVYCQNAPESIEYKQGRKITLNDLIAIIQVLAKTCKNINFVGGEPTPHIPFILDALSKLNINIPIIWNSNMYMSTEAMNLLNNCIDVYLTDFKYGNNKCALKLSGVKNYFNIVSRNHLIAQKQCDVLIRHLVLPNHFECCTKQVLEWIAENMKNAVVNIMNQYNPYWYAYKYEDINKPLTDEWTKGIELAENLGIEII